MMKKILLLLIIIISVNQFSAQGLKFENYFVQERKSENEKFNADIEEIARETFVFLNLPEESITLSYPVYLTFEKRYEKVIPKYDIIEQKLVNDKNVYYCIDKVNAKGVIIEIPINEKFVLISENCENNNGHWCKERTLLYNKGDILLK